MKIVSFNINGLRARPHQLAALIEKHQPDIIGLQETKVSDEQFPEEHIRQLGYHLHYHGQKGHYGVALLSREAPLEVHKGFPTDDADAQRRFIWGTFAFPTGRKPQSSNKVSGQAAFLYGFAKPFAGTFYRAAAVIADGGYEYFTGRLRYWYW